MSAVARPERVLRRLANEVVVVRVGKRSYEARLAGARVGSLSFAPGGRGCGGEPLVWVTAANRRLLAGVDSSRLTLAAWLELLGAATPELLRRPPEPPRGLGPVRPIRSDELPPTWRRRDRAMRAWLTGQSLDVPEDAPHDLVRHLIDVHYEGGRAAFDLAA
jgi:hypothetical protein